MYNDRGAHLVSFEVLFGTQKSNPGFCGDKMAVDAVEVPILTAIVIANAILVGSGFLEKMMSRKQ